MLMSQRIRRCVRARASASAPPVLTDEELAALACAHICIFQGFGEVPLSAEAALHRLLGYTIADNPEAGR